MLINAGRFTPRVANLPPKFDGILFSAYATRKYKSDKT
jgi:hypothetical protein